MLVTIYKVLSPSINLLDGILAMEGNGPGTGGTPRYTGVLIGSDDALSIDVTVCKILGLEPLSLLTNKAGRKLNLLKDFELSGKIKVVNDFHMPPSSDIRFGPGFAKRFLRQNISSRPTSNDELCRLCDDCVKICASKAIKNDDKKIIFDYERCVRCYCCHEVCPHRAINIYEPLLRRAIKSLKNK